jgi:four helix bundle protein
MAKGISDCCQSISIYFLLSKRRKIWLISKDYNRFLEMSLGSSFEAETQLLIAEAINYGEKEKRNELLKEIDKEQKMIMSFMTKLQP